MGKRQSGSGVKVQTNPFRKIEAAAAAHICRRVELSDAAAPLLTPTLSPQGLLSLLVEKRLVGDAVRFLAFALPAREAVWWACVTAHAMADPPTPEQAACLERAAAWVYDPVEAKRRPCMAAAEAAGLDGAAAYAALAAFWSGGSLAPETLPDVAPHPDLAAIGAAASVLFAVAGGDPRQQPARFEAAMERGIDIANGGNGRTGAESNGPAMAAAGGTARR